ncbi:NAD(P)-binding protein [Paracoccaceae bacterium]|nr:NAD(P)-binding protein [Paracoccaceae bacterium]
MCNSILYKEEKTEVAIIGAGVSGLASSYFIGHEKCKIFEKSKNAYGLLQSTEIDGVSWDIGPHLSFTKHRLVRELFEELSNGSFKEFEALIGNYTNGSWLPHPIQANLYALPKAARNQYYDEILCAIRNEKNPEKHKNYAEWLLNAYGNQFTSDFVAKYTRKYWTVDPSTLTIDWIGARLRPFTEQTLAYSMADSADDTKHYINKIRYPQKEGYMRFIKALVTGASINYETNITEINLTKKFFITSCGKRIRFERIISTIPLPEFLKLCHAPIDIQKVASNLSCTSALLVNCVSMSKSTNPYHWFYVYDEDKFSTRVTDMGNLAPENLANFNSAFQVEVYESNYKPFRLTHKRIAKTVTDELVKIGVTRSINSYHYKYVKYANIIYDLNYRETVEKILKWISGYGLRREEQDLDPITDWSKTKNTELGTVILAGRHAQWKYFWSDDCVMRAHEISRSLHIKSKGS